MQWHTLGLNFTTNFKVKTYFALPTHSETYVLTWKFYVDDSYKNRYDIILGRYLLTGLVLNLIFSEHVIEADDETFKGPTTPMVYLGTYIFKILNTEKITTEESFTGAYVEEVYELERARPPKKTCNIRCQIRKGKLT